MWFSVGLVSLVLVLIAQVRFRWHNSWKGTPRPGAGPCVQQFRAYRDSTVGLAVGCPAPLRFRFELKRETWIDRFFKWVGLSVEEQFGESRFDRLVYVASNDRHLLDRMADSPELRQSAVALFERAKPACRVRQVVCANGWLRVDIRRTNFFSRKDDALRLSLFADAVLPHLRRLAHELEAAPAPGQEARVRDAYLYRSVLLLAASSTLAVNGVLFMVRPLLFDDVILLDPSRIAELAVLCGAAVLCVLVLANLLLLGRSARAHLVLLDLLLVGSFGAVLTCAAELREANIEWDRSPATEVATPVRSKSVSGSRKGGRKYYLHVDDWDTAGGSRRIKVSSSFYQSVQPGHRLLIDQHAGYFDARWARVRGAVAPAAPGGSSSAGRLPVDSS